MEEFVCVDDDLIEKYVPLMAKLSYQVSIALYNSTYNSKFYWQPEEQDLLDNAFEDLVEEDKMGFKDAVFGHSAKLSTD